MQEGLLSKYIQTRQLTEKIVSPLAVEDYVVQPIEDVSPPKWHLAHTTWFFENFILKDHAPGYRVFHPDFNFLFNSYYESVGKRAIRTQRGLITRPGTDEVLAYRHHVDEAMKHYLENESYSQAVIDFIELGIAHEQQHQELLVTDIKFILSQNPLFPAYLQENMPKARNISPIKFYEFQEGVYESGFGGEGFHFDNEEERHKSYLRAFGIADRLVSNAEYLEFIKAGGYQQFQHWLSDAWAWVNANDINSPLYWHQIDGIWEHFSLYGLQELDPNAPVTHVSFYEADAYARWKGMRLAKEEEWEVVAEKLGKIDEGQFAEAGYFHPIGGGNDLLGSCWEWCNSAYLAYPGYRQAEGALGEYNGKFMINQMVLKGGSCATPKSHIRTSYRNFFHPNLQWQFSGIRLAKDL